MRPIIVCTMLTALYATSAMAGDAWTVLPMPSRGVEADVGETFRELLTTELSARNGATFVSSGAVCDDTPCARKAGQEAGAAVAVFGRMARLGDKLIVSLSAVDVTHGSMLSNQRMSVDRIEDLEAVATRMAEAIVEGRSVEDTAALGTITAAEVAPDRRREGHSGPSLRVGGMVPFGDSLHAGFGVLFDLGYWYEARDFAIEPRVAFRMSTDVDGEEYYRVGHLDVAAHYILTRTDFAPFIGLGGGLRFADEVRNRQVSIGKAVRLVGTEQVEKSAWGPGAYARLGVLLFRTYTLRVAFTVDYDVTFVELHDDKVPQSIQAGVGVMF